MKVVIYRHKKEGRIHRRCMNSIARGFRIKRVKHVQSINDFEQVGDVGVTFGQPNLHNKTRYSKNIKLIYKKYSPGRLMVFEGGFLKRKQYFALGLGGVAGTAIFPRPKVVDPLRFEALKLEVKDWHEGDYVLLTGQVPWDSTVQYVNYRDWVYNKIAEIRQHTDRPIVWRPHPLAKSRRRFSFTIAF